MSSGNWGIDARFLHNMRGAAIAAGISVLLLIIDLARVRVTPGALPFWVRVMLIPAFAAAMAIAAWKIRSGWERLFLLIFIVDISFKGLLSPERVATFRHTVSPLLWGQRQ